MANSEESKQGSKRLSPKSEEKIGKLSAGARMALQYLCCLDLRDRNPKWVHVNWPSRSWTNLTDFDAAVEELKSGGIIEDAKEGLVFLISDSDVEIARSEVPESVKREIAHEVNMFWH